MGCFHGVAPDHQTHKPEHSAADITLTALAVSGDSTGRGGELVLRRVSLFSHRDGIAFATEMYRAPWPPHGIFARKDSSPWPPGMDVMLRHFASEQMSSLSSGWVLTECSPDSNRTLGSPSTFHCVHTNGSPSHPHHLHHTNVHQAMGSQSVPRLITY